MQRLGSMKGSAWLAAFVPLFRIVSMSNKTKIQPHIDDPDMYLHGREYMLRKRLSNMAIEGAKIVNLGAMCDSCAFKFNSPANLEPDNVRAAHECIAYEMTFNCHTKPGVDKGCECIGFKYAKAYLITIDRG